jgi:tetratricopeptide (TPR) repeat protein
VEAIAAADEALDLAEHLGLAHVLADSLNNKGSALSYLGRNVESDALLRAAVEVAHAGGFVGAETRALTNLGARLDEPELARRWLVQARELALRIGDRSSINWTTETLRYTEYLLGERWDRASDPRGYDEDPDVPIDLSPLDEIRRIAVAGMVRVALGLPVDETIARLIEIAPLSTDAFAVVAVELLRAEESLAGGNYAGAARDSLAASIEPNVGAQSLGIAGHAALWGGDITIARDAFALLEASPATDAIAASDRLALGAVIATLEGRREDALPMFRESLALMRARGGSWHVARRLLDIVVAMGPDHPAAREAADEAREIFERAGARPYLAKLDALLGPQASPTPLATVRVANG